MRTPFHGMLTRFWMSRAMRSDARSVPEFGALVARFGQQPFELIGLAFSDKRYEPWMCYGLPPLAATIERVGIDAFVELAETSRELTPAVVRYVIKPFADRITDSRSLLEFANAAVSPARRHPQGALTMVLESALPLAADFIRSPSDLQAVVEPLLQVSVSIGPDHWARSRVFRDGLQAVKTRLLSIEDLHAYTEALAAFVKAERNGYRSPVIAILDWAITDNLSLEALRKYGEALIPICEAADWDGRTASPDKLSVAKKLVESVGTPTAVEIAKAAGPSFSGLLQHALLPELLEGASLDPLDLERLYSRLQSRRPHLTEPYTVAERPYCPAVLVDPDRRDSLDAAARRLTSGKYEKEMARLRRPPTPPPVPAPQDCSSHVVRVGRFVGEMILGTGALALVLAVLAAALFAIIWVVSVLPWWFIPGVLLLFLARRQFFKIRRERIGRSLAQVVKSSVVSEPVKRGPASDDIKPEYESRYQFDNVMMAAMTAHFETIRPFYKTDRDAIAAIEQTLSHTKRVAVRILEKEEASQGDSVSYYETLYRVTYADEHELSKRIAELAASRPPHASAVVPAIP